MNFKEAENKVTEIVNKVDPDNLVNFGAPADEYLKQVHNIISLISKVKDANVWESEIFKIFFPSADNRPEDAEDKIKNLTDALKADFPEGIQVTE